MILIFMKQLFQIECICLILKLVFRMNRIESDSDSVRFGSNSIRFDSDSRFEFDFQHQRRFLLKKGNWHHFLIKKKEPAPFFNKNKRNRRHFLLKKTEPGFLIKKNQHLFSNKKARRRFY